VAFDEDVQRFEALQLHVVEQERMWLDERAGGRANNPFHICLSDSACAAAAVKERPADARAWMIHCELCDAMLKLGEEKRPFYNFNQGHVLKPSHIGRRAAASSAKGQASSSCEARPSATQATAGPSSSLAPAIKENELERLLDDTLELVIQDIHVGCVLCQHAFGHPTNDGRLLPAV
jgi:hypothetical protein